MFLLRDCKFPCPFSHSYLFSQFPCQEKGPTKREGKLIASLTPIRPCGGIHIPYSLAINCHLFFFFLLHFPSSPFTSFCRGSSLTSAVFIHPCTSGADICLPTVSLDLEQDLSTTCQSHSTKCAPIPVTKRHLLIFFFQPFQKLWKNRT